MVVPSQLQLELCSSQVGDFQEFLIYHNRVSSFQRIRNLFFLELVTQKVEEYVAFLDGMKEIYGISNLKEIRLCQAKCNNGSNCLNHVQEDGRCWRHTKVIHNKTKIFEA